MATLRLPEMQRNVRALQRYLAVIAAFVALFSALFHVLMVYEGQQHSWLTGVYWTLTVMSTLGFGDITFHSDLGRAFSIIVLLTGNILLLVVLPFAFIRFFYAPWLEAQIRLTAPRDLDPAVREHVIVCVYNDLARALIDRLRAQNLPYVVIEPDATKALALHGQGISVMSRENDASDTYVALRAESARLIVANCDDPTNTNITLTIREHAKAVPIVAMAEDKDAIDILELSGASHVVALKHRLGEQLVARVRAGLASAHVVGTFRGLSVAELPARDAGVVGKTIAESQLRERAGLNVIGYWERGQLHPARASTVLSENAVLVIAGTKERLDALDAHLPSRPDDDKPVLVIGGGRVGRATLRALQARGLRAEVLEVNPALAEQLRPLAERVIIGDGANISVMMEADITNISNVILTTHDDGINIYLAVYCRKLNPSSRIISRVTHERNMEAIHRAGADFALSEIALGASAIMALYHEREAVFGGEQIDLFVEPVPGWLDGRTLAESGIGVRTGLTVIGIEMGEELIEAPGASTVLHVGAQLCLLGTTEQHQQLTRWFTSSQAKDTDAIRPPRSHT